MEKVLSTDARAELARRGLTYRQIDALDAALPTAAAWLANTAAMKDVKDKLETAVEALNTTKEALRAMSSGPLPSQVEARNRLFLADFDLDGDGQALALAAQAIERASAVAIRAIADLPTAQRHTNEISPHVMRVIDSALERGALVEVAEVWNGKTIPVWRRKTIERSSSGSSSYSNVVCICLRALGRVDPNPEGMIKAHIRWLKDRKRHFEEAWKAGSQNS